MTSTWSTGVVIGLPVAAIVFLVSVGFSVACFRADGDDWDLVGPRTVGCLFAAAAVVVVIVTGIVMWPWSAEYHKWEPVSGAVTQISSRFVGGDSTSQKYVVTLSGHSTPYACNDTRCALLKPGDRLTLMCKRSWQWAANPGWDCNFGSSETVSRGTGASS